MTAYCNDGAAWAFGDDEQQLLATLMALECVVWVGKPGWGGPEFYRPDGWQKLHYLGNQTRLADYIEGHDALILNTGGPVAVMDVDPRNGGDIEKVRALLDGLGVRIYCEIDTPGGGKHFYTAGHPELPTVHSTEENQRLPGYPGLDIQSHGANVFLPGTLRRKYGLRGYAIVIDELAELAEDGGEAVLADWVAAQLAVEVKARAKTFGRAREWEWDPCQPWNGAPPDARQSAYLQAALAGETEKVAATAPGGRNDALFGAALKLGSYIAGAGLDEQQVIAALEKAAERNGHTTGDGIASTRASIRSGLRCGKKTPRAVPPHQHTGNNVDDDNCQGSTGTTLSEQHTGQVRMAYRLAAEHAGRLLFVHGIGWHRWDGTRWTRDNAGHAPRAVLKTLRHALQNSLGDKPLRAAVTRCESAPGIAGVLGVASALKQFAATVDDIDADPYLLNCANGTLDLHTLQLRPHCADNRITKVCRGAYDPDAAAPLFTEFLQTVLPDEKVRSFVQRLMGLSLIGAVLDHILAIFVGVGSNGKGTLYGALLHALGDYADMADPELFMHREGAHPTGEMKLRGARLIFVAEAEKGRPINEATMKRLTGGDPSTARYMHKDFVTFTPSHLPVMVTNHLPGVSGDSPSVWRRIRVIPFDVCIPQERQNPHLGEQLALEADAILSWAVDGLRDYLGNGLNPPDAVLVATAQYQRDNDPVARFVSEFCRTRTTTASAKSITSELFTGWQWWRMRETDVPEISFRAFGLALDRLGYPAADPVHGKRWRHGIELRDDVVED